MEDIPVGGVVHVFKSGFYCSDCGVRIFGESDPKWPIKHCGKYRFLPRKTEYGAGAGWHEMIMSKDVESFIRSYRGTLDMGEMRRRFEEGDAI